MRWWFVFLILFAFPAGCLEDGEARVDCVDVSASHTARFTEAAARLPGDLIPMGKPVTGEVPLGEPLFHATWDNGGWAGHSAVSVLTWTDTGWIIRESYAISYEDAPHERPGGSRAICGMEGRMVSDDAWPMTKAEMLAEGWLAGEAHRSGPIHAAAIHPEVHDAMVGALGRVNITSPSGLYGMDGPVRGYHFHETVGDPSSDVHMSSADLADVLSAWLVLS